LYFSFSQYISTLSRDRKQLTYIIIEMKLRRQIKISGFSPQLSRLYLDFQVHEYGTGEFEVIKV